MAFDLEPGARPGRRLGKAVRKRVRKALRALADPSPSDEAVHDARKALKQARAALRLVREDLGDRAFRRWNTAMRDSGRPLSAIRDSKVLIDTLDKLTRDSADNSGSDPGTEAVREWLRERQRATRLCVLETNHAAKEVSSKLKAVHRRLKDWPLRQSDWKPIRAGLVSLYSAARKAMPAPDGAADEALHEWRKRTQDLRHNLEFLEPRWPHGAGPMAEQAKQLSDLLGDDHDLLVLGDLIVQNAVGDPGERDRLTARIADRRHDLQSRAFALGSRLLTGKKNEFLARLEGSSAASLSHARSAAPAPPRNGATGTHRSDLPHTASRSSLWPSPPPAASRRAAASAPPLRSTHAPASPPRQRP